MINEELTRLASSETLPPYDRKLACSILYRLMMEEANDMSSVCRASIMTVMAMLIREDVERNNQQAITATNQIIDRLKH
ncbi:hypothetical protein [Pseudomonas duriflava]|uniref:hypothetical protein n=1 Tax=Pseudomonas duriflava TaxID=459528 RepID=UPI0011A17852|nr:hypothetical protein [Pseudomonas duriflava]